MTLHLTAADPISDAITVALQDVIAGVAPFVAILVAIYGLRFLFGEKKSGAAFIGFLLLGGIFYLASFSIDGINSFLNANPHVANAITAGFLLIIAAPLAYAYWSNVAPRAAVPWRPDHEETTRAALLALADLPVEGAHNRLRDQVRLTMIVARERELFEPGSPVTPAHLAKWVALCDRWPEIADLLWHQPEHLEDLEAASAEEFIGREDLRRFLTAGPQLHPVAQHLLYMSPIVEQRPMPTRADTPSQTVPPTPPSNDP